MYTTVLSCSRSQGEAYPLPTLLPLDDRQLAWGTINPPNTIQYQLEDMSAAGAVQAAQEDVDMVAPAVRYSMVSSFAFVHMLTCRSQLQVELL